ncbi:MAG TPA: hypothetical protein VMF52_13815 [Steroidobacteraceae bacterium]|nr:hypothetical protein [Steroidobacteraceae bacterium]
MSASAAKNSRPHLRLVSSSLQPTKRLRLIEDWRRVAAAINACTHDLSLELREQRWGNVDEALRERRELLEMMARMQLDTDGRRCLVSLQQAIDESERAITAMMGSARRG